MCRKVRVGSSHFLASGDISDYWHSPEPPVHFTYDIQKTLTDIVVIMYIIVEF